MTRSLKVVAVVAAKKNSNRFPGKNLALLGEHPLFWHSVMPLNQSERVDDVYVTTDSEEILKYCHEKDIKTVWRGPNVTNDNEPLLEVLKFAYKAIPESFDILITIMANCPNHTVNDVNAAVDKLKNSEALEVRGFNSEGKESGLMAFRTSVILQSAQISSHIEMIVTKGTEIHYCHELNSLKN